MATVKHLEWLDSMLGDPTHSAIDLDTDTIDVSLLDQTDAGTILNSFVDYDEVDAATVVATGTLGGFASLSGGVATLSGAHTFTSVSGDAVDYLTAFKNSGTPATSPLIITWDSASTGIPVTPNGGDIISTWGSNIFVTLA